LLGETLEKGRGKEELVAG